MKILRRNPVAKKQWRQPRESPLRTYKRLMHNNDDVVDVERNWEDLCRKNLESSLGVWATDLFTLL